MFYAVSMWMYRCAVFKETREDVWGCVWPVKGAVSSHTLSPPSQHMKTYTPNTTQVDVVNGPTVGGSAVVSVAGLLAGFQASYNTQLDEKDQVRVCIYTCII